MQPDLDVADLKRISELIYERYNYDFRNYAMSSFKRRVVRILELKKLTLNHLLNKLDDSPPFIHVSRSGILESNQTRGYTGDQSSEKKIQHLARRVFVR